MLPVEIEFVWSGKLRPLDVLYLVQRYMPFVDTVIIPLVVALANPIEPNTCRILSNTCGCKYRLVYYVFPIYTIVWCIFIFPSNRDDCHGDSINRRYGTSISLPSASGSLIYQMLTRSYIVILTMRTWAIWGKDTRLTIGLPIFFLGCWVAGLYIFSLFVDSLICRSHLLVQAWWIFDYCTFIANGVTPI
jgi:hypothetical protein